MKVFLSHPMSGLSETEVRCIRESALACLKKEYGDDVTLIDNYNHTNVPDNAGRLWHLGTSVSMMEDADLVIFCSNWNKALGCLIEHKICQLYGLSYKYMRIPSMGVLTGYYEDDDSQLYWEYINNSVNRYTFGKISFDMVRCEPSHEEYIVRTAIAGIAGSRPKLFQGYVVSEVSIGTVCVRGDHVSYDIGEHKGEIPIYNDGPMERYYYLRRIAEIIVPSISNVGCGLTK